MAKVIGTCNSCKKESVELQKKSHIISKFLFNDILGKPGDGDRIEYANPYTFDTIKKAQDSPYEKHIFCRNCEVHWSKIETKASYDLFHNKLNPNLITKIEGKSGNQLRIKEADTINFKKFLLLNLFRAHHSTLPISIQVNLGKYERIFAEILLEESNIKNSNCSVHFFNFREVIRKELRHFCTGYCKIKVGNRNAYSIYIDGLGILYHFGKHDLSILDSTKLENSEGLAVNILNINLSRKLLKDIFHIKSIDLVNKN